MKDRKVTRQASLVRSEDSRIVACQSVLAEQHPHNEEVSAWVAAFSQGLHS